jgi:hypothetical protein
MGGKSFWIGVVVGVGAMWAFHAFAKPLPRPGS